jgi:hypothetical protein
MKPTTPRLELNKLAVLSVDILQFIPSISRSNTVRCRR